MPFSRTRRMDTYFCTENTFPTIQRETSFLLIQEEEEESPSLPLKEDAFS